MWVPKWVPVPRKANRTLTSDTRRSSVLGQMRASAAPEGSHSDRETPPSSLWAAPSTKAATADHTYKFVDGSKLPNNETGSGNALTEAAKGGWHVVTVFGTAIILER